MTVKRWREGRSPEAARLFIGFVVACALGVQPGFAQEAATTPDTRAGRFDNGKMWTFEYAPAEYFSETYSFDADAEWFEQARLGALRIPGCSAAFVSPHGLVVTNHHCARGSIVKVSRPGENLLDTGFYAPSLEDERRVPDYYADQLIHIEDISGQVFAETDRAATDAEREQVRNEVYARIRQDLIERFGGEDIHVEITPLYHGGRYSAYVFRRYDDLRLVAAPEEAVAFFGGDPDNFTYPRYALDFTFFRMYGEDGRPMESPDHFTWSRDGVEEDDVVFVIGNPGPTNRLNTVAELEYQRDVQVPALEAWLKSHLNALRAYAAAHPEDAERRGLRNRMFSLSNSLKATTGRLAALEDSVIMARRRDAEEQFRAAMQADPELSTGYGDLFDRMAEIQDRKAALAGPYGAFYALTSTFSSPVLRRALAAHAYMDAREDGAGLDSLASLRREVMVLGPYPADLEAALVAARLAAIRHFLGPNHAITEAALNGMTPEQAAVTLLNQTIFADSARTARALETGTVPPADPAWRLVQAVIPAYRAFAQELTPLAAAEAELAARLGRARFEVYGTEVAPDATFSPRITDGVVQGYEYNGTEAPPYTTFFGMYDRYYGFGEDSEWDLPAAWLPVPPGFDLNTPLNFVSTADTYGGNSGSPVITPELELVGLNFDRNIEGLSRDFIYLPERGRNVMVDVRAIQEALDDVYDADRVVMELTTKQLFLTEQAADAATR